MKSTEHIQNMRQKVDKEYNELTTKILNFFKGQEDSSHIILVMNAFIDDLYARYDELAKEYINTLLDMKSCQDGTLNDASERNAAYYQEESRKETRNG